MPEINAICSSCGEKFIGKPSKTFLGFQKMKCPSCKSKVLYPLTNGYRAIYWVLFFIMLLAILGSFQQGGFGLPGGIGLAVIVALLKDRALKKK